MFEVMLECFVTSTFLLSFQILLLAIYLDTGVSTVITRSLCVRGTIFWSQPKITFTVKNDVISHMSIFCCSLSKWEHRKNGFGNIVNNS